MKFSRLQKIFEEVKIAQDEQAGFSGATPYSILVEQILNDSSSDFCLAIAEKAINISRGKSDRPEPVLEIAVKRTRRPKAHAIYGATDG